MRRPRQPVDSGFEMAILVLFLVACVIGGIVAGCSPCITAPQVTPRPRRPIRSRCCRGAAIRSLIVTRPACQPRSGNWTP
jgi:hypothetical protein